MSIPFCATYCTLSSSPPSSFTAIAAAKFRLKTAWTKCTHLSLWVHNKTITQLHFGNEAFVMSTALSFYNWVHYAWQLSAPHASSSRPYICLSWCIWRVQETDERYLCIENPRCLWYINVKIIWWTVVPSGRTVWNQTRRRIIGLCNDDPIIYHQ